MTTLIPELSNIKVWLFYHSQLLLPGSNLFPSRTTFLTC
jgi:hypothetical protein